MPKTPDAETTDPKNSAVPTMMEAATDLEAMAPPDDEPQAPAAPEERTEPAETPAEPPTEDAEPAEEEKPEEPAARPTLTEEQQRIFNERLGKEVAKRKTAEERLDALRKENEALKAAAEERTADAARSLQVLPDYLKPGEAELLKRDEDAQELLTWAVEHWDGYESEDGKQSFTAAQVRRRYAEVRREADRIAGRAETIRERARAELLADVRRGREKRAVRVEAETAARETKPGVSAPVGPKPTPAAVTRGPERRGPTNEKFDRAAAQLGPKRAAAAVLAELVPPD